MSMLHLWLSAGPKSAGKSEWEEEHGTWKATDRMKPWKMN